jgi:hypothetical protein
MKRLGSQAAEQAKKAGDAAPRSIQPHRLIPPVIAPSGVMIGTMDAPHAALSHEDYKREIERCLMARGYHVRGWH